MPYEIVRFPYDGAVDADGHVVEPASLWLDYLEPAYRDRAIRVMVDDDGYEYLELDGAPSRHLTRGMLGVIASMGDETARPSPERRYMEHMPYGGCNPVERLDMLERENLDAALLYPTLGVMWECEVRDPELGAAYLRAYNRWVADFCRDSKGRLVAVAHLSLYDPEEAARELDRAVADGCKGAFVASFSHTGKSHGHPDHDVVWARASELGIPVGIHPTFEPRRFQPQGFEPPGRAAQWYYNVLARQTVQQAFLSFFAWGTFDRFPHLKLGVLESGCGWIGSFLDRMDAVYEAPLGRAVPLAEKPSHYFRRQCFISGDPDETAAPHIIEHVGADRFMWASDYPHPDHSESWVEALVRFVEPLSSETRARVLGMNTKQIYELI